MGRFLKHGQIEFIRGIFLRDKKKSPYLILYSKSSAKKMQIHPQSCILNLLKQLIPHHAAKAWWRIAKPSYYYFSHYDKVS